MTSTLRGGGPGSEQGFAESWIATAFSPGVTRMHASIADRVSTSSATTHTSIGPSVDMASPYSSKIS
ncbi:hypothetical protein FRIGORI9N_410026 [Frigoribacterium sp. 9N]|nr:hypothetical protein FRIGORI9N_410026 [Frigoribacterium sp. 9N]